MKKYALPLMALIVLSGCSKTEGPGGTSSITGFVKSQNHQNGQQEITEIIFVGGLTVEHGDYWVLNSTIGEKQYYIYYDNPTWVSEADPFLEGRTGIAVEFNYSDSNVEIAANTLAELSAEADNQFTFTRNVDVVTITNKRMGEVADCDKITSPFEFNTDKQGKNSTLKTLYPAIDEKVYLVYGDQEVYGDLTRTGGDGEYQFNELMPGNYTVYSISKDTLAGGTLKVLQTVEITDKKSVVTASDIHILN